MNEPKGRGRPKMTEETKRKVYPFRMSDQERQAFTNAAKAQNLTLPKWLRKVLTDAAGIK